VQKVEGFSSLAAYILSFQEHFELRYLMFFSLEPWLEAQQKLKVDAKRNVHFDPRILVCVLERTLLIH
jgi:hypothetical protein